MEKIAIIGAGLVGSLQAIILAKKGYKVDVYERRMDMRKADISAGRSINLALSNRGWKAIELAGITDEIMKMAIPMYGRMMHPIEGETFFQQYGKDGEAIYSVSRGGLNQQLMNSAEALENVDFHFDMFCLDVDLETNEVEFLNTKTDEIIKHKPDRIFATDGAFSAIRSKLQKTDRFNYEQMYLEHGYKELYIPATETGVYQIDKNALHIWPRGNYMLIALANEDGSFTCTLFFPFEGEKSFESLKTKADVQAFFSEIFPDAIALMPSLIDDYFTNPTSSLVTVRCSPWNHADKILMMGDASHAIVPFYGQGMNSGFEDCSIFNEIFEKHNRNWNISFQEFSKTRKKDADAISNLAIQNFVEMRDLVADESFLLRKKIEKKIYKKHPQKWMPLYSQVTFSHIPYSEALANGKRQEKIMDQIMAKENIQQNWDTLEIEQEILRLVDEK
ncbi:MAG: FAD-dependent monooxygenase [Bacteroidetes bacterium]|nr:MAG: FAD-dependent monooxygenase [Bacteroidota bacterium]MBL1143452.1 FAD-dependent monooxygenase [Bacteroidota bacterium]NOG56256.1 FAD-dependent monooxygenase [Bacteroidota bacterium]